MITKPLPELLAPAGNLEKLKIAFTYGADAVYVGGHVFGLRKYAENFTLTELSEGVALANRWGRKVYVVLNGFAHGSDIAALGEHLKDLEAIGPHGFIISDMGVLLEAKRLTSVPLHVSTQASVLTPATCQFWKDAGATRVILGREASLADCRAILKACDIELEIFVHGAMCASFSGKCVISNYSAGRDSNRGGCVQSCRHPYAVETLTGEPLYTRHIMNAKDLNALALLPEIVESGISSIKIEGRMKSNLYVAHAVMLYRKALDLCITRPEALPTLAGQLSRVSNRQFSTGGLSGPIQTLDSINPDFGHYEKEIAYLGTIKQATPETGIVMSVRSEFKTSDHLGLLQPSGLTTTLSTEGCKRYTGESISRAHPNSVVTFPYIDGVKPLDIIFKWVKD